MVANNQEDIKERLKKKMAEKGVKVPRFAKEADIPKDRVYAWYRDNSQPKTEDQDKIEKWINGEKSIKNEENGARGTIALSPDLTMQALFNLTESNRTLAESNKTLADSQKELVSMVKIKPTDSGEQESLQVSPSTITDLLLVIAEIGTKAGRWKTKSEAHAELHKIGAGVLVNKK